jgi:hybrid cluster-associated redox disulfide protein
MMESEWSLKPIAANSLVQEVVDRHPEAIAIFCRYGLQCVGCYISPHHTIADSAREYAMPLDALLRELNRAVVTVHEIGVLGA